VVFTGQPCFCLKTRELSNRYSLRMVTYSNNLSILSRCSASLDLPLQHSRSREPQIYMGARVVVSIWSVQVGPSDSLTSQLTLSMSRHLSPQARKLLNPAFSAARMRDLTPLFHGIGAQESLIGITGNRGHSLKRLSAALRCVTGTIGLFTGD
jgi:hypothetical protein